AARHSRRAKKEYAHHDPRIPLPKRVGPRAELSLPDERNDLTRRRRLSLVHLAVASDHRRIAGSNQTRKPGSGLRDSEFARATDDKTAVRVEDRRHLGGRAKAYRCWPPTRRSI